jgi:membrane fusion protein, multidrug efflux system
MAKIELPEGSSRDDAARGGAAAAFRPVSAEVSRTSPQLPETKAYSGTEPAPLTPVARQVDETGARGPGAIRALLRRWRPSARAILLAAGILVAASGSQIFWLRGGRYASTDDAYVEAARLLVTTDVSGIVLSVNVHENETVAAGGTLFRLDPRQFEIALENSKANLQQTALTIESMKEDYKMLLSNVDAQRAQVALDQVTFDRNAALVAGDNVSRETYDQARYTLQLDKNKLVALQQQAQVQLAKIGGRADLPTTQHPLYLQAKAQVDEAQRQLDHATVRAPFSGTVTQVDALQPGVYLFSQTAAFTGAGAVALVSNNRMWITAQMKETDLTYVRPGNAVTIAVDTYPGQVWSGIVENLSPASGSEFSVLPAQNTSGNWVKVVQRIPVRISIERKPGSLPLRSGMSVSVSIDTGHRRSLRDLL